MGIGGGGGYVRAGRDFGRSGPRTVCGICSRSLAIVGDCGGRCCRDVDCVTGDFGEAAGCGELITLPNWPFARKATPAPPPGRALGI